VAKFCFKKFPEKNDAQAICAADFYWVFGQNGADRHVVMARGLAVPGTLLIAAWISIGLALLSFFECDFY
jgi:hypothetical protein